MKRRRIEKKRNDNPESAREFALSLVLTNILVLAVIGGVIWLIYLTLDSNSQFNTFLRGGFLP